MNNANPAELWLRFIAAETEEELEELRKYNNPMINKAIDTIYEMSDDPEVVAMAKQREQELRDDNNM